MANIWCVAPSHPLVKQIAEEYNVTKKDAKAILNSARKNDPSLNNDNLTLEYLKTQQAFIDAVGVYNESFLNVKDLLSNDPGYGSRTSEDAIEELRDALGVTMTEDEVNEQMEKFRQSRISARINKNTAEKIARILQGFRDSKRIDYIGQWMTTYMTEIVTGIETSDELRGQYGLPKMNYRIDYFKDETSQAKLKKQIEDVLQTRIKYLEDIDPDSAEELKIAKENIDTFLYVYGANFKDEGIKVDQNGNITSKSSSRNQDSAYDDENDENDEDQGESPIDSSSLSDQNKSAHSRVIPDIKKLFNIIRDVDQDGNEKMDIYGYHLWRYMPGSYVTNQIHQWMHGINNFPDMLQRLKNNVPGNPWVNKLISYIDYDGVSENGFVANSKKEQLQTMFFISARMQHTMFRQSFVTTDEFGNAVTVSRTVNVKHVFSQLRSKLYSKFERMSGLPILKDKKVDFHAINQIRNSLTGYVDTEIMNAYNTAVSLASIGKRDNIKQDFSPAFEALNKARKDVVKLINDLGIIVTNNQLNDFLNNNPEQMSEDQTFWAGSDEFGDKKFETQWRRLVNLKALAMNVISQFDGWNRHIYYNKNTKLNASINPLSDNIDITPYPFITKIRWAYNMAFDRISQFAADTYESRSRIAGKDYNAENYPSVIQTLIEEITVPDIEQRRKNIMRKFGQDKVWFLRPDSKPDEPHFYSDMLESLYYGTDHEDLMYSEMPSVDGKSYSQASKIEYNAALLNSFFQGQDGDPRLAWYRPIISSDKNRFSLIRWKKHVNRRAEMRGDELVEDEFRAEITNKAVNFFGQELTRAINVVNTALLDDVTRYNSYDLDVSKEEVKRIVDKIKRGEKITVSDVVEDGRYIFRQTGASFFFSEFLNKEIEKNSELGQYIVDRIFNSSNNKSRKVVTKDAIKLFKAAFPDYMKSLQDEYFQHLQDIGLVKRSYTGKMDEDGNLIPQLSIIGDLVNWHKDDEMFATDMYENQSQDLVDFMNKFGFDYKNNPEEIPYYQELYQLYQDLEVLTYNNWLFKANSLQITHVDPAFYGNTQNLQKRASQQVSSGIVADPNATIHGKPVSDEFYRSITIKTFKIPSSELKHIKHALYSALDSIDNPTIKASMKKIADETLHKLTKMDTTDGQGLVGLSSLRKRMVDRGEWSRSATEDMDEKGYSEDENGNNTYIFTDEAIYRRLRRGYRAAEDQEAKKTDMLHASPQPQKDFVYATPNLQREGRGTITVPTQHKNSEAALIFLSAFIDGMELNSKLSGIAKFLEYTVDNNDNGDTRQGIDTVNWDSAVKIGGNNRAIDLSDCKNGQEVFEALKKAVYEDGKKVYKKDGTVTVYDKNSYKIIQQNTEHFKKGERALGAQVKIHSISNLDNHKLYNLPSGEFITGAEVKKRYFKALKDKTRASYKQLRNELGYNLPFRDRLFMLASDFSRIMQNDSRFTSEQRRALTITNRDGVDQFVLPLDDPSQQLSVEANIIAKTRDAFYRAASNGGIAVQATSWDSTNDLHIRFYDKQGKLLPTEKEYLKVHPDGDYEAYRADNQGDYAYMEMEVVMPKYVRDMLEKIADIKEFLNEDGSWNMGKIKEVVPDSVFDAICYRIPTEAKYSIMKCRIVRFTSEWDTAARYPAEITTFTGSDFDIDKDFVELRPKPGNRDEKIDNEIFDMQITALSSSNGILESFMAGDFSDLSEFSYKIVLARSGKYSEAEINAMSPDELKKKCTQLEDIDMMGMTTDSMLHAQNMESKDMIAIAAVAGMSHSFLSTYNESPVSNRNGALNATNIDNNLTIKFFPAIFNSNTGTATASEQFKIVYDKAGKNITKTFKDKVVLDPIYDANGDLISTLISKYVGGSADAIKDPALSRLNINTTTLLILCFMQRIGIPRDMALLFISSQPIRDITDAIKLESNFGYKSVEMVCDDLVRKLARESGSTYEDMFNKYNLIQTSDDNTLKYSELMAVTFGKIDPDVYMKLLHIYTICSDLGENLRNLDGFTRYNSSAAMRGSTFIDRYAKRQQVAKLRDNLNKENPRFTMPQNVEISDDYSYDNYGRLCSMFPYIADTINAEDEILNRILVENMHTYNSTFFRAISDLGIEEKPELMKILYNAIKNYLFFVGSNRIVDFWNPKTVVYYTRDFANHYYEKMQELQQDTEFYKNVIENNSFINSIYEVPSKPDFAPFGVLATDINGIKDTALEEYQRDWEDLLNYPQTRKLATDLAIYFMARRAGFSNDTPVTVMPTKIKEAIPNYIKVETDANREIMSDRQYNQFMVTYLLNNVGEKTLIPHLYNTPDRTVIFVDEKNNTLYLNKEHIHYLSRYLRQDTEDSPMYLKLPIIAQQEGDISKLYYVVNSNPLEEVQDEEGNHWLAIEAMPTEPLGIPNQFSEYTGLDLRTSIFAADGNGNAVRPEFRQDENYEYVPTIERFNMYVEERSKGVFFGRRSGTFVQSLPFGEDEYAEGITERALSRNTSDFANNPYLESRIHLRRVQRLADFMGIKTGTITRSSTQDGPAYNINIPTGKYSQPAEQNLKDYAALISTLGFGKPYGMPVVKTYVTDPTNTDFNAVELTIKIGEDVETRKITRSLLKDNSSMSYELDSDANEIRITAFLNGDNDNIVKNIFNAIQEGNNTLRDIKRTGGVVEGDIEINYMKVDYVDVGATLNNLSNYAEQAEQFNRGAEAQNNPFAGEPSRTEERREIRLQDIVNLAQRRRKGEKVNSELRDIFGETRQPLRNPDISYSSRKLADTVAPLLQDSAFSELVSIVNGVNAELSPDQIVDNVIINTANWIIGNRPRNIYGQLAKKEGMSKETSDNIIDNINKVLDELNIC